jgi:hypothetical protein
MNTAVAEQRLRNQHITRPGRRPEDIVAWLGAVQAQEYAAATWALGLRMRDSAVEGEIEWAFEQGRILRTHVMRPTWHFVAPSDIRWLLHLTASRVHRAMSPYNRRLELDAATFTRATVVFERALRDHRYLTRTEFGERLRRVGLVADGVRLAHLAMFAEIEGVVCSGPRRGKQFTYALVAERAPQAVRLPRDEALAELSRRYFRSHGPATIRDFVWWSGLTTADAKRGLEMNKARRQEIDGQTYWTVGATASRAAGREAVHMLPVYDEYLGAYRDRKAVPSRPSAVASISRGSTFRHALVIAGQVAGTWRTSRTARTLTVEVVLSRRLTGPEQHALAGVAARYGRFLGVPMSLSIA